MGGRAKVVKNAVAPAMRNGSLRRRRLNEFFRSSQNTGSRHIEVVFFAIKGGLCQHNSIKYFASVAKTPRGGAGVQ